MNYPNHRPPVLPEKLEQRLSRLLLDRFTGNVQLNIKEGRIRGFLVSEMIELPSER